MCGEKEVATMWVSLIGNKDGVYIDPKNCNAAVDYEKAVNFKDVKMFGVNRLVIKRLDNGDLKIVQAGGYNRFRCLFVYLY